MRRLSGPGAAVHGMGCVREGVGRAKFDGAWREHADGLVAAGVDGESGVDRMAAVGADADAGGMLGDGARGGIVENLCAARGASVEQ